MEGTHDDEAPVPAIEGESFETDCDEKDTRFVIRIGNTFRTFWTALICILLLYTGTVFVFVLCFLEFRASPTCSEAPARILELDAEFHESRYTWLSTCVTGIFTVDLLLNFFFSYQDEGGAEVVSQRRIAWHYLTGFFIIDVLACTPEPVFNALFTLATGFASGDVNQAARLLRMNRLASMGRIVRIVRIGKCASLRHNALWVRLMKLSSLRVVFLSLSLLWVNHIAACGWYFCAAVHDNPCDTWLGSRLQGDGDIMLNASSFTQWMNCMYFVITVFTTVGFGDFSVATLGEVFYVAFIMMLGSVVHSIVIGEVIQVMTSRNAAVVFVQNKVDMVQTFGVATGLNDDVLGDLTSFVRSRAASWFAATFDKSDMIELVEGQHLSRGLLESLPHALYKGQFCQNRFFCQRDVGTLTPRLPLMVALYSSREYYKANQNVYQVSEFPISLYLVMNGVFAYVATPGTKGGLHFGDECALIMGDSSSAAARQQVADDKRQKCPFQLFPFCSYFGDIELVLNLPRATVARCESKTGEALALHNMHLKELSKEFPDFHKAWYSAALRRSQVRAQKQRELVSAAHRETFRQHAALLLQRFMRRLTRLRQLRRRLRVGERSGHDLGMPSKTDEGAAKIKAAREGSKSENDVLHEKVEALHSYIHKVKEMIAARGHVSNAGEPEMQSKG